VVTAADGEVECCFGRVPHGPGGFRKASQPKEGVGRCLAQRLSERICSVAVQRRSGEQGVARRGPQVVPHWVASLAPAHEEESTVSEAVTGGVV
jgi:hypothetical protein